MELLFIPIIIIFIFIKISSYKQLKEEGFFFFSASKKGRKGEREVAKILSQLPDSEYSVINDLTLQNEHGSVQIDHIVISLYGIFVIETKNYSGWIMGGEKADQWIKNMFGHKYYFYNPIKQNDAHISVLARALFIPKDNFISIIAFSNKSNIKVHSNNNIVYFRDIIPTIYSYSSKIFSIREIDLMTNKLCSLQSNSNEEIKEHISYVKNKKIFSENAVQQGICPHCGSPLKIRNGKYGPFIGCSNYPKCKYTHPL